MDIITCIITTIGELLVKPTGKQLGYLFCYEANIKALVDESEKLKDKRGGIQMSIDAANRNLEVITPDAERWVSEVDKFMNDQVGKFLEEDVKANKKCFNGWCPNLKLQHSLGRKAKKYTEVVLKLQKEGKPFAKLSCPAPQTGMRFSSSYMKDFDSRKKILNQVMEALRDEKVSVTAICGTGGIGKTTMAKEVAKRANDEKLFGEVVMVTVSQNPDVHQIQGKIADFLGLKLDKESEEGRADKLRQRILKNIKNILVILDDLWKKLDLEAVGIPDGCKILLTSRSQDVCKQMESRQPFPIQFLSEDEAWTLFEEVAGISDCTRDLHKVAKKVANECKGLPVAIVTVGSVLKNREEPVWKDALLKLKKLGPDLKVFNCIKLSYDYLENKEEQKCFLLCCLFPEDYNIDIETLARYGKGLRLFEGTDTMEEATNRVYTLVQKLKRCFLLMDGDDKECVKMHDIIRDVAITIAKTKEHGSFIVRCDNDLEEWPKIDSSEMEECTAISLVCGKIKKHPDSLVCPKLKLLSLSSTTKEYRGAKLELSEKFFGGIKEIKVLAFGRIDIQTLPASLQMLQNLRALHLEYCVLGDISIIGGLKMLEILSLISSEIQEELPKEIGNLQHLKLLDMTGCKGLKRIPPGVLSRLTTLEELKILWFEGWSSLEGNEEKTSASLDEITPLLDRYLKVLSISIPQVEFIPRSIPFKNLSRFSISVNRNDLCVKDYLFGNSLILGGVSTDGIHPLVKKCEYLNLREVYDLKNLFPHFDEEEQDGFPWLRDLSVWGCKDMEYLVKFTSNNKRTDLHVPNIFPFLDKLSLGHLDGLKGIFHCNSDDLQLPPTNKLITKERISTASSLPGGFPHLQRLYVSFCTSLEEIVSVRNRKTDDPINTSTSDDMILFPKLTELTLRFLPSLISLCRAIDDEALSRPPKDADGVESSTDNMNIPTKILFPFKCIKWLPSLADLTVAWCNSIKVLFSFHGDDSPQLAPINRNITNNINVNQKSDSEDLSHKKCCLIGCLPCSSIARKPNIIQNSQEIIHTSHLTEDGDRDHHVDNHKEEWLKNLEKLQVILCDSLEVVFDYGGGPLAPALNKLKCLTLFGLQKLMHIWKKGPQQVKTVGFKNLKTLSIKSCPSLRYLFTASIAKLLVMLESLEVVNCKTMEEVVAKTEEENDNINAESYAVSFPHLVSIELNSMKNLYCFCQQPYAFEFPSLETLEIRDSPKVQTFVTANKTLTIPKLEGIDLHYNYMEILEQDLNGTIRHQFEKNQDADGVESSTDNMSTPTKILFPFKCIKWLPSLATLRVDSCRSIKILFSFLGDDSPQLAPINRNITNNINVDQKSDSEDLSHKKCCIIGCLPCSSIARKPNIIQNSQEIIHTSHLTEDGDCDHHVDNHKEELPPTNHQFVTKERISTASPLPRGFPQLQYLSVCFCTSLEEIVSLWNHKTDDPINTSTSDDMILFPKLTKLTLWVLPRLISLCRAIDDEALSRPPKDADGVESSTDNMNTPTKILFPFKCIKWLPSLANLEVEGCDSIKVLFSFLGDDSPQLAPINRNIINNINVDQKSDSEDLSHKKGCLIGCLPCSGIARKPNTIQNSQEIIHTSHLTEDGDRDHHVDNHKEEWLKNLEELDVCNCVSLEVIFDYGGGPLAPALNKLKILELNSLQKLMHIWKKGPQQVKTVGFKNLKTLSIKSCPSLRYLFTASIAKLLVMLESLKVANCESMEEVVAKTEEEINNVNAESYAVSFPHLVSIKLNFLDNLYCFCQQPYAFEFPSLETLQIRECPKLQTFVTANKTPNIPKLKVVNLNGKDMEISKQDLNGTIRH